MIKAKKTTKRLGMIIIFILLLAALGLTGCGSKEEPVPVIEEGAAEVEAVVAEVTAVETATAEVDEAAVEGALVEETAVIQEPTDECLACHIDKEMLIATAAPEEEVISENEGEG